MCVVLGEYYDKYTGVNYVHRREWIRDKILSHTDVFAIDCCAYAVMSNHYHVVLFVDEQKGKEWARREVLRRWKQIFNLSYLTEYYQKEPLSKAELNAIYEQNNKNILFSTWNLLKLGISIFYEF